MSDQNLQSMIFIILFFLFTHCTKEERVNMEKEEEVAVYPPVNGSRIAWDFSTLKRVSSSKTQQGYNGYARVVQLHDLSLLCVYEANGNVVVVKSINLGATWSEPITVVPKQEGVNMAVPDLLELEDKSILICYNPRPYIIEPSKKFSIRTIKSYDGGTSWKDGALLYEAGYEFENGCWEPAAVQLPDGEIQLFFANEGIYKQSTEQNISLLRSSDNGITWTPEPEIVSFRAGSRDGMPSPLLLQNKQDLALAIEDNGTVNFKPFIIHSTIEKNWSPTADANSVSRTYALADTIKDPIYAGAPFLGLLKNGETVLSYQGTEDRVNKLENAEMKVVIGNSNAMNFNRKTVPFAIPGNKSGLWNSISVLENNKVIALTSTNAFTSSGVEVWMILGHVLDEIEAINKKVTVDGILDEPFVDDNPAVFIGHNSIAQLRAYISYDDQNLYIVSKVVDPKVKTGQSVIKNNDGVTIFLDVENKSIDKPDTGIFKIFLSSDNIIEVNEGNKGKWVEISKGRTEHTSGPVQNGYVQEIAIPWSLIGRKPALNVRIGLNMSLTESTGKATPDYIESISSNNENQPYSWMTLKLR